MLIEVVQLRDIDGYKWDDSRGSETSQIPDFFFKIEPIYLADKLDSVEERR